MLTTGCHRGLEPLTRQQTIEVESLLLKMEVLIECLQAFAQGHINAYWYQSLERFVPSPQMLQRRSSRDLLIQLAQIKSSLSNLPQKEEKDTSMTLANPQKLSPCLDGSCPQCSNDSFSSLGMKSQDTENQVKKSL